MDVLSRKTYLCKWPWRKTYQAGKCYLCQYCGCWRPQTSTFGQFAAFCRRDQENVNLCSAVLADLENRLFAPGNVCKSFYNTKKTITIQAGKSLHWSIPFNLTNCVQNVGPWNSDFCQSRYFTDIPHSCNMTRIGRLQFRSITPEGESYREILVVPIILWFWTLA